MQTISGSTLAPHHSSAPIDLKHWRAHSDDILSISQLPKNDHAIHIKYNPDTTKSSVGLIHTGLSTPMEGQSLFESSAVAVELLLASPSLEHASFPRSASRQSLPATSKSSSSRYSGELMSSMDGIGNRVLDGHVLVKADVCHDLIDADIACKPTPSTTLRGYVVRGDATIYGGEVRHTGNSHNTGVRYSSDGKVVGAHLTHTLPIHNWIWGDTTTPTATECVSVDVGGEYLYALADKEDSFTIGGIATWRGPQHNNNNNNSSSSDEYTVEPRVCSVLVNGIGTLSAAYSTPLTRHHWTQDSALHAHRGGCRTVCRTSVASRMDVSLASLESKVEVGFKAVLAQQQQQQQQQVREGGVLWSWPESWVRSGPLVPGVCNTDQTPNPTNTLTVNAIVSDTTQHGQVSTPVVADTLTSQHTQVPTTTTTTAPTAGPIVTEIPSPLSLSNLWSWATTATHTIKGVWSSHRGPSMTYSYNTQNWGVGISGAYLSLPSSTTHHTFPPVSGDLAPHSISVASPGENDGQRGDCANPRPWYPMNEITSPTHTNINNVAIIPAYTDAITERLALCSRNGEHTLTPNNKPAPHPVWNALSGFTWGITVSYGDWD